MFGYVRPLVNQLSREQREAYQGAYCGLCHVLGRRHGWLARFTLNYDFTLLAILHYGLAADGETTCRRCPAHPFQKKRICLCGQALELAADESMILAWYKLSDDIADRTALSALPFRILRSLLRRGYRRAAQARPAFDRKVKENLEQLHLLEAARSPRLDRVADTFAGILSAAAGTEHAHAAQSRTMEQLLYHLGRWIYLIDAWDDLAEDQKHNRYNPLDARFAGKPEQEREYVETTMTHSIRLIWSAANLLELGSWQPLVENILFLGLPSVQQAVLDGRWKELKKQRRYLHERSLRSARRQSERI